MNTTKLIQSIISKPPRIAVIGDYIEDRYILAEVTRVSPEAPVVVARKVDSKTTHGGAGNVWATLSNLGADAYLFCDSSEKYWRHETKRVFINQQPHSIKTRVMSGNHHLLRIDEEPHENEVLWGVFQDAGWSVEFIRKLEDKELDCVVIADYHKGVVSKSVAEMVVAYCQDFGVPCIVDAKKDFERFSGATIIKCNQREANAIEDIWSMVRRMDLRHWVVTQGQNGIDVYINSAQSKSPLRIPGIPVPIVDVCGAGDTVTAIMALCLASNNMYDVDEVVKLANFAAAEACKNPGVYLVSHEDLLRYEN